MVACCPTRRQRTSQWLALDVPAKPLASSQCLLGALRAPARCAEATTDTNFTIEPAQRASLELYMTKRIALLTVSAIACAVAAPITRAQTPSGAQTPDFSGVYYPVNAPGGGGA